MMPDITFKSLLGRGNRFLSAEEEREHFRKWREEGDQDSHNILVRSVAPLMLRQALKFVNRVGQVSELEEYESAALEGLVIAIQKFDPEKGTRLSTYASFWWDRMMKIYFHERSVIRVPNYLLNPCYKSTESAQRSWVKGQDDAQRAKAPMTSLCIPVPGQEGVFEVPGNTPPPDEIIAEIEEKKDVKRKVRYALSLLTERERSIILGRNEGVTLKEIGKTHGLTKERVRQIENSAKKKMRDIIKMGIPSGLDVEHDVDNPALLLEKIQTLPVEAIDQCLENLELQKEKSDGEYRRRKKLLTMIRNAVAGVGRGRRKIGGGQENPQQKILDFLGTVDKAHGGTIRQAVGLSPQGFGRSLKALVDAGKVRKYKGGDYCLVYRK